MVGREGADQHDPEASPEHRRKDHAEPAHVGPDMRWLSMILTAMFWAGFGIVLVSTFPTNHFELFGLQQAWHNMMEMQADKPELRQPLFYRWVAHPLYAGFFLAFWATPHMT